MSFLKRLAAAVFPILNMPSFVAEARGGSGVKKVGKPVRRRAVLPDPLTRQLRRQQERLAVKGRALI